MMEDQLLIWRFKRGSQDALCRIYEKYKDDLLKLAVALATDVNTAEDAVQDVFVTLAQSGDRIRSRGDLRRYLMTCVANRVRNRIRDLRRHEATDLEEAGRAVCAAARPEQWAVLSEQLTLLSAALAQIPYEQREVISLYMQGDMTFRQIARAQNASINTVQGRYRYGMNKLRSLLNGEHHHETDR